MNEIDRSAVFAEVFALDLPDEQASHRLAEDVAMVLRVGDIVSLSGDLGAGKTTLARAILRHLADDDALEVPSPTYTLVQSYETRPKATHFDLYRIAGEDELAELGFEEAAETGIVLVEWPERSALVEQETNVALHLDLHRDGGRRLVVRAAADGAHRLRRSLAARRFLIEAGFGEGRRRALTPDASVRRYETVQPGSGPALILMDSPPPPAGAVLRDGRTYAEIAHLAQTVVPFVALSRHLDRLGFTAPRIHAANAAESFVLLEDLGTEGVVDAEGRPIAERYEAAARAIARLHAKPVPSELDADGGVGHRVPPFDPEAMLIEVDLLPSWFLPRVTGSAAGSQDRKRFEAVWRPLLHRASAAESRLVLRDVHSPNLLWQEGREGDRRVGLLDFQDAMTGPGAYDIASLAQDARVDMAAELEERLVAAYCAVREREPGFDLERFRETYAVMAAQRATKILGIFVRLHERDGKPQYLRHIPRIQRYLQRTLVHPALGDLRALYREWGVLDAPFGDGTTAGR